MDPLALYDPVKEVEHYIDGEHNGGYFNPRNMSVYGYCYQSPVIYVDPNGKQSLVVGEEEPPFSAAGIVFEAFQNAKCGFFNLVTRVAGRDLRMEVNYQSDGTIPYGNPVTVKSDPNEGFVKETGKVVSDVLSLTPLTPVKGQVLMAKVPGTPLSAKLGNIIGWGKGQEPHDIQKSIEVTMNLTKSKIQEWVDQGLTKSWVQEQLNSYTNSLNNKKNIDRNTQIKPRKELMEKILKLWE